MKNKKLLLCLFMLLFLQPVKAQNGGFKRFVQEILHEIFSPPPETQMVKLANAMKNNSGGTNYIKILNDIEKKLLEYKRNNSNKASKYETSIHLTLAMIKYEKILILNKSTTIDCEKSFEYWLKTEECFSNLPIGAGDSKDLDILVKHGKKIGFKIQTSNLNEGMKWIKEQKKLVEDCPIPYNCKKIDNERAYFAYAKKNKPKSILKDVIRLKKRLDRKRNGGSISDKDLKKIEEDAFDLLTGLKKYSSSEIPITTNFVKGILYDIIKQNNLINRIDSRTACLRAHDAWAQLVEYYTPGSYEFVKLNNLLPKPLKGNIDSSWIYQQYETSKNCYALRTIYTCDDPSPFTANFDSISFHKAQLRNSSHNTITLTNRLSCHCIYEGCTTDTAAYNYVGNKSGRIIEVPCDYIGCMDSCYENYDSNATIPGPCYNYICTCLDSCYVRIDSIPDSLAKHNDSICQTLVSTCGCTNPCSPNFNRNVIDDDGSCIETCGCKDPDADNYDNKVAYHKQSDCIYSKIPKIDDIQSIINDFADQVQQLTDRKLQKNIRQSVRFKPIQNGGGVGVNINLKVTAKQRDLRLGQYQSQAANKVVDMVMDFLQKRSPTRFDLAEMKINVIGEADGHQIKSPGLKYIGQPINNWEFFDIRSSERHKIPDQVNSIVEKRLKAVSLNDGDYFNSYDAKNEVNGNTILAFLRGFMVAKRIKASKGDLDLQKAVSYGAINNAQKGGEFRKVNIIINLEDYNYDPGFKTKGGNGTSKITDCLCPE